MSEMPGAVIPGAEPFSAPGGPHGGYDADLIVERAVESALRVTAGLSPDP